jgi:hypothetical protein
MTLVSTRPDPTLASSGAIRAFLIGTLVGIVVVGGFCGGMTALMGGGLAGAIAVGAFTAFWGGPGFGGMMGFIVYQARTARGADDQGAADGANRDGFSSTAA